MAIFIPPSETNSGDLITSSDVTSGDLVLIQEDVSLISTFNNVVDFSGRDLDVVVKGELLSVNRTIDLDSSISTDDFRYNITIEDTGDIVSQDNYTLYVGTSSTINPDVLGFVGITNAGSLTSFNNGAVFLFNSAFASFENSGTVTTFADSGSLSNAVIIFAVFDGYVTNSGLIQSFGTSLSAENNAAINFTAGNNATLVNTGTVQGVNFSLYSDVTDSEMIQNHGLMLGTMFLSDFVGGTFINTGIVSGEVLTQDGDDLVTNGGLITGVLDLGTGDDTYTAIGDGQVLGVIEGGIGNDTITGGALADFIDGGDDNDRLFGRGGDDDLRGGLGSDFMSAGAGDDFVLGDNGADRIFGGGGEDTLQGGRDLDTIRGGDGADEINGGRSADVLRGGAGADTFLYQFRQDSTLNLSDRIQDFEVGVDVIDVAATASQLSFVGSAAFSGTGNEVRYEIGGNGRTFVEVDTDANGVADMRILLGTVGALTEDDFVL